ncbi:MAG: hypothetical protein HOV87_33770 [Catenulispora sp.]|nr:hypothetical protein [Catenulispora sp.]
MTGVTKTELISTPIVASNTAFPDDECHRLPSTDAEKRIVEALPQVSACVVVSARLEGRVKTDVLLQLHADVDQHADYEPAVRAALDDAEAETLRRVFVIGLERDFPEGSPGDRDALARWHYAELLGARLLGGGPGVDRVPVATERVPVDFAGPGSGEGELSWGQREIWQAMTRQGNWLPLGGVKPLDPGTTVQDIADELAYVYGRFPSMRTRLRFDERARPYQVLFAEGRTHLEVFDAADGDAAADELATAVAAHYERHPYDMRAEWPVRMAVVRQGGAATRMVVMMHHLALDGGGAETMLRDVAERATEPPTGLQQLELAAWQYSPAGRRQTDRAMRYFGELLRAMPVPTFPASADPRRPPWWTAEYSSPALPSALALLAARTGADLARVTTAGYAIALARVTGVNPVLLRPVIGNRFRRQLADVVCHASQAAFVLLDTRGTVEDVIERTGPASMNALKHSFYDPEQLDELVRRIGEERGAKLDVASFVNYRRVAPATPEPVSAPTREEFAAQCAASVFRWAGQRNDPVERLFINFDDAPGAVRITIEADTRALAPAQIERVARGIEEVAVEAALQEGLDTGVVSGG